MPRFINAEINKISKEIKPIKPIKNVNYLGSLPALILKKSIIPPLPK